MSVDSTRGKLLVALPALGDPNFDRTVVYMIEHNDEGAFGLVLNRPSESALFDALVAWNDLLARPTVVFGGGPVQPEAFVGLAEVDEGDSDGAWANVGFGLGTVDLSVDPDAVRGRLGRLRIFHGYSGWGADQLEQELDADAWLVLSAELDDVFSAAPEELWRAVLRRQAGRTSWLADFPDDLAAN